MSTTNIINGVHTVQQNNNNFWPSLFPGLSGYDLYVQAVKAHRARREAASYAPTAAGLISFLFWAVVENMIAADIAVWAFNSFHGTEFRPERRSV